MAKPIRDDEALARLEDKVDTVISLLRLTLKMEAHQMADLTELAAAVEQNGSVVDSAVALITDIADRLEAAAADDDPAAVQTLSDELRAKSAELAAAVEANTPGSGAETPT